jgi:hypothetical protein
MRRALVLLALAAALPFGTAKGAVDLPAWGGGEAPGAYSLGGALWPRALLPGDASELAATDPAAPGTDTVPEGIEIFGPPAPARAVGAPARFFGPEGLDEGVVSDPSLQRVRENPDGTFTLPEEPLEEEEAYEPLPPLEGELADLYFSHAPIDYLVDPQRLLTEQKSNDIMRFLEFHADESKIRIYVMAIGENQVLPEGVDLQALHREWFSDDPAVVMLYYREKPEMTELFFNESIRDSLPKSVFDRIRQNCLREGAVADFAPDQVEKMAIELSIQLYWLSRLMENEGKGKGAAALAAASNVHEMIASPDAPELLREYAPGIFVDQSGRMISLVLTVVFVLGGLAAVGCFGWILMWWRGRETVSGEPILFPEFRITRRLGGEFSGGGFVGMSFDLNETAT